MINWKNKMGVALCALLLTGSMACGNNAEEDPSACADGEIEATINGTSGCYVDCTADESKCGATQECKTANPSTKLCVTKTVSMNNNNVKACTTEGEVEETYEGEKKCWKDCSADATVCGTDECKTVNSSTICVPKEVVMGCGTGEVETVVGGGTAQCFKTCTGDPDCAADGKVCKADDGGQNMVCVQESEVAKLCKDAAEILLGDCLVNNCAGLTDMQKMQFEAQKGTFLTGGGQNPSCEANATQNAEFLALLQQLVGTGCDGTFVKLQQCYSLVADGDLATECGCKAPDYDKGCTMDTDCEATVASSCIPEDATTKSPPGGICSFGACQVSNPMANTVYQGEGSGCGEGGLCLISEQNGALASQCINPCTQTSDCARAVTGDADAGYVCRPSLNFGGGQYVGTCAPACATDADCLDDTDPQNPVQGVCGNDRSCEPACTTGGTECMMIEGSSCVANTRDNTKSSCHIPQAYMSPF